MVTLSLDLQDNWGFSELGVLCGKRAVLSNKTGDFVLETTFALGVLNWDRSFAPLCCIMSCYEGFILPKRRRSCLLQETTTHKGNKI